MMDQRAEQAEVMDRQSIQLGQMVRDMQQKQFKVEFKRCQSNKSKRSVDSGHPA